MINMNSSTSDNTQLKVILLANQPRMMRETLHRVLEMTPDMRLVLETDEPKRIPRILDRVQTDWLIATLTEDEKLPEAVQTALEANPSVSVIGISADGSHVEVRGAENGEGKRERLRYSLENITLAELLKILGAD